MKDDFEIVKENMGDRKGNIKYRMDERNLNKMM